MSLSDKWERLADLLAACGYPRPRLGDSWAGALTSLIDALERLHRTQDDHR